jgi:hypothetical protein
VNAPTPLPGWAQNQRPPLPDGVVPPVEAAAAAVQLTDPDADGHRWIVFQLADGTMSASLRMPWQAAPGFLAACANRAVELAAQAQAEAGPQIVVPPAGLDLSKLNLGRNPNGHNGRQP